MNGARFTTRLPAALLVALAAAADAGARGEPEGVDPRLGDRLMVRVLPGAALGDFVAAFEANHSEFGVSLTPIDAIEARRTHLLRLDPPDLAEETLDLFEADLETNPQYAAILAWSEFLYEGQAPEGRSGSFWFYLSEGGDLFGSQLATELFGLPEAHQVSAGTGVVVAVLDTGLDAAHPVLAGRIAPGGWNFVQGNTDTTDSGDGQDTDGDGSVDEMVGHGTFVASLIALVAPGAQLLPVRVLEGDGVSDTWIVAKGLYHAIDQGAAVINASLGSTYKSDAVSDAVEEAREAGITVIAAAGNMNRSDPEEHPAITSGAFGVAATDDADLKAGFSNYHGNLTLSALGASARIGGQGGEFDPGRSIIGAVPGGDYAIWEGTSMAVPFASGAAALLYEQHPLWAAAETTHDAIEEILTRSAVPIDEINPGFEGQLGAGRLDVAAAVMLGAGDLDQDGAIGVADLLALLAAWGACPGGDACLADLDGDLTVGVADLLALLSGWT